MLYPLLLTTIMVHSNLFPCYLLLVLNLNNFVSIYVLHFVVPTKVLQRLNSGDEALNQRTVISSNLGGLLTLATFYQHVILCV